MRLRIVLPLFAALLVLGSSPAGAVVCDPPPGQAAEAIQTGWPPDAPHEFVFVATIREITPVQGDSHAWGEIVELRVDAVLRGDLPLAIIDLYNPPLGASGWGPFRTGGQYLIAANPSPRGMPGYVMTTLCSPNEEVTTEARLQELLAYSAAPVLADTAVSGPELETAILGWTFLGGSVALAITTVGRRASARK